MIRLWKLGDCKSANGPILPSKEGAEKFIDLLSKDRVGATIDIVWDDMVQVTIITDDGQIIEQVL